MSYAPTTPVKQLLGEYVADDKDENLLHCRVPNRVANRSGGPDSVFTWISALGEDQFVWRPVDSQHATLGHCLDVRRDGDEGGEFFTHADMADMMNSIQGPGLTTTKDNVEWPQAFGFQQQQQQPFAFPMQPPPFSLPPPSGGNSPNSLFDEPDNARDFSPPASPTPLPQAGSSSACSALPPPLILPGGDGTVAPRDIFSPLALPHLPLPASPPSQTAPSAPYFPPLPPHPADERRARRTRTSSASRTNGWDDSDYDMSDADASGDEDDSDFAGPSTSASASKARGGTTRKSGSAGSSPRGSESTKTPLPCGHPGCSFVQRNGRQVDLSRHELTHWPARPKHTCPDCGHTVSRKDALRRHQEQSCKKTGTRVQRTPRRKARRSFN